MTSEEMKNRKEVLLHLMSDPMYRPMRLREIAVFLNVSTESVADPVASEIFSFVPVTSTEPRLKSAERSSVISVSPTVSLKIT